ncbi:hypothetical protein RB595_008478 [Gaeumannomyces hyphopodioides]
MEPVPETERMEEFKSTPLPPLRMHSLSTIPDAEPPRKPPNMRRSTEPASPSSPSAWFPPTSLPYRPRTTSPLSGSTHVRSKSAASLAPPMIRTQSLPAFGGGGHFLYSPQKRSQSPSRSPSRPQQVRLPRKPVDEAFPSSPTRVSVHDPERRQPDRSISPTMGIAPVPAISSPLARTRPTSPLRHVSQPNFYIPSLQPAVSYPNGPPPSSSTTPSPSYKPYDSLSSYSYGYTASMPSSSVPSTPTSMRSRSPSISSLETIPDTPDAEEAALEAERIAQLKAAADAAERGETKGRGSLDVPVRGRTIGGGFGSRDKRKRWSVCGAERRGDIDLETIWED